MQVTKWHDKTGVQINNLGENINIYEAAAKRRHENTTEEITHLGTSILRDNQASRAVAQAIAEQKGQGKSSANSRV